MLTFKRWSRPASIVFSLLFIAIMCFALLPSPVRIGPLSFGGAGVAFANGEAWLTGYSYRVPITIGSSTGSGTNYQVKLLIGETSGATGENFDLAGHTIDTTWSDGVTDLKFTDNDGNTSLDFWWESTSGTGANELATYWVEVADSLESSAVIIYCYYGKTGDTYTGSGSNTFLFFDDFNDASIDGAKWAVTAGVSEGSGVLTLTAAGDWVTVNAIGKTAVGTNVALRTSSKRTNDGYGPGYLASLVADTGLSKYEICDVYKGVSATNWITPTYNVADHTQTSSVGIDTSYHIFEIFRNSSTNVLYRIADALAITEATQVPTANLYAFYDTMKIPSTTGQNVEANWVLIRKCIATEPAFSSAGSEEEPAAAPSLNTSAATSITGISATLNGSVTARGGSDVTVTVYWGDNDGGTTPGNWDNSSAPTSPAQPQGVAAFYKDVTGLSDHTTYYFTAKGVNVTGTTWATTLSFTTPTLITDFPYNKQLIFNTSATGANVMGNQANFPVCIDINSSSWPNSTENAKFFGDWNVDGKRCMFFDSDQTTPLDYEPELYSATGNTSTNKAIYWVRVPSVAGNSTTDSIWIAYGADPTGVDQSNPTGVWDTIYKAIIHMNDSNIVNYGTTLSGYGDSVTMGYSASDAAHRYLNLVANNSKIAPNYWAVDNQGYFAYEIQDIANTVYPDIVNTSGKSLSTVAYNDSRHWGTDATAEDEFEQILYAVATWNSIPQANKLTGQGAGIITSGSWINTSYYGGALGIYADGIGEYVEFTIHGTVVYIGLTGLYAGGGNYSITVDTVEKTTGACTLTKTPASALAYTPFGVRIAGLTDTNHTVRVTVTSAANVYFDWAAGNEYTTNFFMAGPMHMNAAGYLAGDPTWNHGSIAITNAYNTIVSGVASTLSGDGLKVHYANVNAYYNEDTDVSEDNVHPNNLGHQHIADAFIAAIDIEVLTAGTDTSHLYDSTAKNSSPEKVAANQPVEIVGQIGIGQDFDGSNDYVTLGSTGFPSGANTRTISFWVNMDDMDSTYQDFVEYGTDTNYQAFLICTGPGGSLNKIKVYTYLDDTAVSTGALSLGTWAYVCVRVIGAKALTFTINTTSNNVTTTQVINTTLSLAYIGYTWNANYPNCKMDEVRISNGDRGTDWTQLEYYSMAKTNFNGDNGVSAPFITWDTAIANPVSISNTPSAWSVGIVQPSQTYWSNGAEPDPWPLEDADCWGNLTNNSSFAVNILASMTDMIGGTTWGIGSSPGTNVFTLKIGIAGKANVGNFTTLSNTPVAWIVSMAAGNMTRYTLVFYTPTNSPQFADGVPKSGNITFEAEAS